MSSQLPPQCPVYGTTANSLGAIVNFYVFVLPYKFSHPFLQDQYNDMGAIWWT